MVYFIQSLKKPFKYIFNIKYVKEQMLDEYTKREVWSILILHTLFSNMEYFNTPYFVLKYYKMNKTYRSKRTKIAYLKMT